MYFNLQRLTSFHWPYRLWIATLIMGFLPALAAPAEIRYEVTDLSLVIGGNRTARGINEAGQVVGGFAGGSVFLPPTPGFLWDPENGATLLTNPNDPILRHVAAKRLNNAGQVAGTVLGAAFVPAGHPFVWDEETGLVDVGYLSGPACCMVQAHGINDLGLVVGTSADFLGFASQAFIWDSASGIRPLDDLRQANSINNAGQIVGQGFDQTPDDDSTGPQAVLLDPVVGLQDLGTLPGSTGSSAADINELGHVVGSSDNNAFLWQDGVMSPLDAGSLAETSATAINNGGTIIGFGSNQVALVWEGGTLDPLNDLIDPALGWQLEYASDINDRGQIVGWGTRDGFGTSLRAFLLTPITETDPSSDYNGDGAVDAADYVVWRKSGGTPEGYTAWRENFGMSLGPDSGSTLPSVAPLSATVPEPATIALLLFAFTFRFRTIRRYIREQ
jgi:probable HAF family extracellular repeat protein